MSMTPKPANPPDDGRCSRGNGERLRLCAKRPRWRNNIYALIDMPKELDGVDRRHGAYWLHPDGWYRLYPPAVDVVQILPAKKGIWEPFPNTHPTYRVVLNGENVGELHWNMTGYSGMLPTPSGYPLLVGEGPISRYKRAAREINREAA
jgi:hypothetical protein